MARGIIISAPQSLPSLSVVGIFVVPCGGGGAVIYCHYHCFRGCTFDAETRYTKETSVFTGNNNEVKFKQLLFQRRSWSGAAAIQAVFWHQNIASSEYVTFTVALCQYRSSAHTLFTL